MLGERTVRPETWHKHVTGHRFRGPLPYRRGEKGFSSPTEVFLAKTVFCLTAVARLMGLGFQSVAYSNVMTLFFSHFVSLVFACSFSGPQLANTPYRLGKTSVG